MKPKPTETQERNELDELLPAPSQQFIRPKTALWLVMVNRGVAERVLAGQGEPGDLLPPGDAQ